MPQQPMQPNQPQHMQPMAQDDMPSGGSRMPWLILGIIVIVLIVLGIVFRAKLFGGKAGMTASGASGYQAVFLTNGQVYFGKLSRAESDYVQLDDIYYLQVVQPPLQGQQQPGQATTSGQTQPQISLIKLGNELHGPVDEMHISRSQVLFYEDLKSDGQVVKAIIQDKNSATSK